MRGIYMINTVMLVNHKRCNHFVDSSNLTLGNFKVGTLDSKRVSVLMICDSGIIKVFCLSAAAQMTAAVAHIRSFGKADARNDLVLAVRLDKTMVLNLLSNGCTILVNSVGDGSKAVTIGNEFLDNTAILVG